MCGIVGHIGPRPVELNPALEAIRHRGPDDRGTHRARAGALTVDLGFVRLAILDLSVNGHQPMANDDGSVWLVFNGEIYNFRELRAELERAGHRFRSSSDSEVILRGYEAWGDDVVLRLRGMFGLAIWDQGRERLLAARDRLGIKPFFWSAYEDRFWFGSEMKAILAMGVPREMRGPAVAAYLRYNYVPRPLTIFRHIDELLPGHTMVWEGGKTQTRRYWRVPRGPVARDEGEVVGEIARALDETVRLHLESDVPVGAFLSGGLDSSTLVALMARHSTRAVRTFCMTFGEGERLYDERQYARVIAERFGTDHTEIPVKPDLAELLPAAVRHFDEPFGNPTALLSYLLSRETRRHVTVALAGDGGDEIFLGYPRYTGAALRGHYARVPEPLRRLAAERLAPLIRESRKGRHVYRRAREFLSEGAQPVERMYENWVGYFGADDLRAVVAPDLWRPDDATEGDVLAFVSRLVAEDDSPDLVDRVNHADIASFLPNNLLHYTDRMSMAHSLEVRVPYCDHVLAELLLRLPASQKMSLRESKRLMRKAVAGLLPPEILKRPKLGFNPPMGIWLAGALRGLMEEKLADTRLRAQGIFRPEPVRRMMEDHLAGRRDLSLHLWAMLVLQTWLDVYQP